MSFLALLTLLKETHSKIETQTVNATYVNLYNNITEHVRFAFCACVKQNEKTLTGSILFQLMLS